MKTGTADIPPAFIERIKKEYREESDAILASLVRGNARPAIRLSWPVKSNAALQEVPWCAGAYFAPPEFKASRDPGFHCGQYYVQDAATLPVIMGLPLEKTTALLDMCAAPGGKFTHIAARLKALSSNRKKDYSIYANEIIPKRARIVKENCTRLAIGNAVIINDRPEAFCRVLKNVFDLVVLDVPCSGEALLGQSIAARYAWSPGHVRSCARRQRRILMATESLLRPDGILSYSTCTFSYDENEDVIAAFLEENKEWELYPLETEYCRLLLNHGLRHGKGGIGYRMLPHCFSGEGGFFCYLKKKGSSANETFAAKNLSPFAPKKRDLLLWQDFLRETGLVVEGDIYQFGKNFISVPSPENIPDLRVHCGGTYLGSIEDGKCIPHHDLVMSGSGLLVEKKIELGEKAVNYFAGHDVAFSGEKGYYAACYRGHICGWGEVVGKSMKSLYPRVMRTRHLLIGKELFDNL